MQNKIGQRTSTAFLCLLMSLALALSCLVTPPHAYAATSAEKQAEADEVMRSIDTAQSQLSAANAEFDRATQAHEDAKAAADDAAARAEVAHARMLELQDRLSGRAEHMYKAGGTSFFDVLLGSSTFEELLTSWDALERITGQDADMISESKAVRAEAEAAEAEHREQQALAAKEMEKRRGCQI